MQCCRSRHFSRTSSVTVMSWKRWRYSNTWGEYWLMMLTTHRQCKQILKRHGDVGRRFWEYWGQRMQLPKWVCYYLAVRHALKGFYLWASWHMAGKGPWLDPDGSWTYPDTNTVMNEMWLQSIAHYVEIRQQHISGREWGRKAWVVQSPPVLVGPAFISGGRSTCRSRRSRRWRCGVSIICGRIYPY